MAKSVGLVICLFSVLSACNTAPTIEQTALTLDKKSVQVVVDCSIKNFDLSQLSEKHPLDFNPLLDFNKEFCSEAYDKTVAMLSTGSLKERFASVELFILTGGNGVDEAYFFDNNAVFIDKSGAQIPAAVNLMNGAHEKSEQWTAFADVEKTIWGILTSERHKGTLNGISVAGAGDARYLGQSKYIDEVGALSFHDFSKLEMGGDKLTLIIAVKGVHVHGEQPKEATSQKAVRATANTALSALSLFTGGGAYPVILAPRYTSKYQGIAVLLDNQGSVLWNHLGATHDTNDASELIEDLIR